VAVGFIDENMLVTPATAAIVAADLASAAAEAAATRAKICAMMIALGPGDCSSCWMSSSA